MTSPVDAYLGLGSNIKPEVHLSEAVALIKGLDTVTGVSSVWETPPIGVGPGTEWFLNAAVRLRTSRSPQEIITHLIPSVESDLGRIRDPQNVNAPRTIDIDLLLHGEVVGEVAGHTLPDPGITRHIHVAGPLSDLNPGLVIPGGDLAIARIASTLRRGSLAVIRDDLVLPTP